MNSEQVTNIIDGWKTEVDAAAAILRQHAAEVGEMEPAARMLALLLLFKDELALKCVSELSRALREWQRYGDLDTSRVRGELPEHLEAERAIADAVAKLLAQIS